MSEQEMKVEAMDVFVPVAEELDVFAPGADAMETTG